MRNKLKSEQEQKRLFLSMGREFLGYLLDLMLSIYLIMIVVVLPFYYQEGFLHIGTDKATVFRQINLTGAWFILPIMALYLLLCKLEKKVIARKLSITDKFVAIYGVALLLSYICSDYQEKALWGADGWFMGLFTQLCLIGIYFLVSRCWKGGCWLPVLFGAVSAVVFGLGYLNRFGVFPMDMKVENVQFISTIGNINWYCGYLVSVFFGGYYFLWQSDKWGAKKPRWQKAFLWLYVAIGFATLVTQGSLSGLVTLAVIFVVTFCLSAKSNEKMLLFGQEVLLFSLACLCTFIIRQGLQKQITYKDELVELLTASSLPILMAVVSFLFVLWMRWCKKKGCYPVKLFGGLAKGLVVAIGVALCVVVVMIITNTIAPGSIGVWSESPFFTFSPTWGSNRATTWKAGLRCFGEQDWLHKLVGVGPDCMAAYLHQDGSEGLQQMVSALFGSFALTNAHNEWITVLVNTGILGVIGFVGMIVSAIVRYLKQGLKFDKVLLGACGFCLLAYTINNMFSFQQSVSAATIFVILGIGEAQVRGMLQGVPSRFSTGQNGEE